MGHRTHIYRRFFDQILDEIVLGNVDQALGRLVGMLDGLALHACSLETARHALHRHPLHQLLLEAPLYQQGRQKAPHTISPAGLRLTNAIQNLGIMRALDQRREFAEQKVALAARRAQKICLFNSARQVPVTADVVPDGVTIVQGNVCRLVALAAAGTAQFDLICAHDAPDFCDSLALRQLLTALLHLLAPRGTALVSAWLPHHTGSGWAHACLNWRPHVHAEAALRGAATLAGLSPQLFRDGTGSFAWCVLQRRSDTIDQVVSHGSN